jgi:hypothetical protein
MSTRTRSQLLVTCGLVLAAVLLPLLLASPAPAQQLTPAAQPPATRPPTAQPAATPPSTPSGKPGTPPAAQAPLSPAPMPPVAAVPPNGAPPAQTAALPEGVGLCQCIADKDHLVFSCPGSVDACHSACGQQYSFKPDALCHVGQPVNQ